MSDIQFFVYRLIGDITDTRAKQKYTRDQIITELKNERSFKISKSNKNNVIRFELRGILKYSGLSLSNIYKQLIQIDFDEYFKHRSNSYSYIMNNIGLNSNDYNRKILTYRDEVDKIIFSMIDLYSQQIISYVNSGFESKQTNVDGITNYLSLPTLFEVVNRDDISRSEVRLYVKNDIPNNNEITHLTNYSGISKLNYICLNYCTNSSSSEIITSIFVNLPHVNHAIYSGAINDESINDQLLFNYSVIWKIGQSRNSNFALISNNFEKTIISKHLYYTWNVEHYHTFLELTELVKYYEYNLFRTYVTVNKAAGYILSNERRFYYGIISNITSVLEVFVNKESTNLKIENQKILDRLRKIHLLTGIPIFDKIDFSDFMTFRESLNTFLEESDSMLTELLCKNLITLDKYYICDYYYDFIKDSSIAKFIDWTEVVRIGNGFSVNITEFKSIRSNNDYLRPVIVEGHNNYLKCTELLTESQYVVVNTNLRTNFNIGTIDLMNSLNLTEFDVDELVDSFYVYPGWQLLNIIRREIWLREIGKSAWKLALEPLNVILSSGMTITNNSINSKTLLFLLSYSLKDIPSYSIVNSTLSVVNPVIGLDIKRIEPMLSTVNSSTFKLSQMLSSLILNSNLDLLNQNITVIILGAIVDPLREFILRISQNRWIVKGYGDEAFNPNVRLDVTNFNLSSNGTIIISDIDYVNLKTSDEIADKMFDIIQICDQASLFSIIKANYPITKIYMKLNSKFENIPIRNFKYYSTFASPYASYEHFLVGSGIKFVNSVPFNLNQMKSNEHLLFRYPLTDPINITQLSIMPDIENNYPLVLDHIYKLIAGTYYNFTTLGSNSFDLISIMKSISDTTIYGRVNKSAIDSLVNVRGFASIKELALTKLIGKFGAFENSYGVNDINGFIPDTSQLNFRVASPSKSFSNAQRVYSFTGINFDGNGKFLKDLYSEVHDYGCRDFEGIIYTFGRTNNCQYNAYDLIDMRLKYDIDNTPQFKMVVGKFTIDSIISNMLSRKNNSLFIIYNSLFMSYDKYDDLYNALDKLFSTFSDLLASLVQDQKISVIFSLYTVNQDLVAHDYPYFRSVTHDNNIYFTLDTQNPVASITKRGLIDLIEKYNLSNYMSITYIGKNALLATNLAYGVLPNPLTYNRLTFYNMCQTTVILSSDQRFQSK